MMRTGSNLEILQYKEGYKMNDIDDLEMEILRETARLIEEEDASHDA